MRLDFTKAEYDYIKENCLFTEDEEMVLNYKIRGKSDIEISFLMNVSARTVQRLSQRVRTKIKKVI